MSSNITEPTGVIKRPSDTPLQDVEPLPNKIPKVPETYGEHLSQYLRNNSLPNDLNALFDVKKCSLCNFPLAHASVAKIHYLSRKHNFRVKQWMETYCANNNVTMPTNLSTVDSVRELNADDDDDDKWKRCPVCDVSFNSKMHASAHYSGKKHLKAASQSRATGQTIVKKKVDGSRFGIGKDFTAANLPAEASLDPATNTLCCEVCNVPAMNFDQLQMHINGAKHQRVMKIKNAFGELEETYKNFRTPSGHYNCVVCKITVTGIENFNDHMRSKKHLKKKGETKVGEVPSTLPYVK